MARKIIIGDQEFIVPDKFPKSGVTVGLILVFIYAIWSSIFRVELEEEGVLLTLGEYSGLRQSGIHLKWPAPIQTVIKIPTKKVVIARIENIFVFFSPEYLNIFISLSVKSVLKKNWVDIKKINGNISKTNIGVFIKDK